MLNLNIFEEGSFIFTAQKVKENTTRNKMAEASSQESQPSQVASMQQVNFAKDFSQQDFKVFELPDDLLDQIESGSLTELMFKSLPENQNIVLCANDKTYTITQVETSNTILLRNKSHPSRDHEIQGSVSCFYEVVEKKK